MIETTDIKTRADGSIDTAHYMARGRVMRSEAFYTLLGLLRGMFAGRRTAADSGLSGQPGHRPTILQPGE